MATIAVQCLLAALLFMLVNWLGRHSVTSGYLQLSLFSKVDEAPAFNFLFRVLAPTVYLLIVAAGAYAAGLDEFVANSYLVAVYYVAFRWLFNIAVGRASLLNWSNQLLVGATACGLAFVVDRRIIQYRDNLLPDFATIANEIWLLVFVFVYQAANQLRFSTEGPERRKQAYLRTRYARYRVSSPFRETCES